MQREFPLKVGQRLSSTFKYHNIISILHRYWSNLLNDVVYFFSEETKMYWYLSLPIIVGSIVVIQGGMNRELAANWGLPGMMLLNSVMYLIASAGFFLIARFHLLPLSPVLRDKNSFESFSLWYLIPGAFGFIIVLGVPMAIARFDTLKIFICLVAAQMITSLLWDKFVDGIDFSFTRVLAASITVVGASINLFTKN